MFAVFNKNIFQDWWLNPLSDGTWVERTIAAKGWNANDVKVVWFAQPPAQGQVVRFNPDQTLTILEKKMVKVQGQKEPQEVWADGETRNGQVYFNCGAKFPIF